MNGSEAAPDIEPGEWINSQLLTLRELRGDVVLLEFWTFGCYNCRNTLPFLNAWHKTFSIEKFAIIGVHTPEFESEKRIDLVRRRVLELAIEYPVITDNESRTWSAYKQRYWPVMYLIDKKGIVRYVHTGEGAYDETERKIRELLAED